MIKHFNTIVLLMGSMLFAQVTDLSKENIKDFPKNIEESTTKAVIRANMIEGYNQDLHQKTAYNSSGMIKSREIFNDSGDLMYTESYTYDEQNRILKIETLSDDETNYFLKEYEYTANGYTMTFSEHDALIQTIEYQLDQDKNIISQKETSYVGNEYTTLKTNEYKNGLLVKQNVKFGNDGNVITFKYNDKNLPIEEVIYDLKNRLVSKKRRAYDEQKNIIEEYMYDQSGRIKMTHRIKYIYDEKGNWTTRTQYTNSIEEPISNSKRTIRY